MIQSSNGKLASKTTLQYSRGSLQLTRLLARRSLRYHFEINFRAGDEKRNRMLVVVKQNVLQIEHLAFVKSDATGRSFFFLIFRLSRKTSELKAYQSGKLAPLKRKADKANRLQTEGKGNEIVSFLNC